MVYSERYKAPNEAGKNPWAPWAKKFTYGWREIDREKTLGVSLRHTNGQKKISLRHTSHFWGCHQGMSRCQNPEVARSDIPKNYNTMNQKQKIKSTYQAQEQRQSIQSLPTFRQEETMQNQHPTLAPCHK